jgi:predicted transcriptional regulator
MSGRTVLLSIKPRYADLILAESKKVEFRRAWARTKVNQILIYATVPIQKLVGIAEVKGVTKAPSAALWKLAQELGGGLSKEEIGQYFTGKDEGYALLLGKITPFPVAINPESIFDQFVPPQSFRYLTEDELLYLRKFVNN